jgi:predicted RNase H-like HicB family nuclease
LKKIKNKKELIKYYMNLPYAIKVIPEEAGGYSVKIEELPGCISQGETIVETIKNIKEVQEVWLEVAIKEGLKIPVPKVKEEYSGKFVLRIPKSLHRKLSDLAREEGISLNQIVVTLLSERYPLRKIESRIQGISWLMERMQKGLYDLKKMASLSARAKEITRKEEIYRVAS